MKRTHYSKRMLHKQDCVKFRACIAWQSFFENNFADFSDVVRVKKKIKISSSHWWGFLLATSPIGLILVLEEVVFHYIWLNAFLRQLLYILTFYFNIFV